MGDVCEIYGQVTHLGEGIDMEAKGAFRLACVRWAEPSSFPTASMRAYFESIEHRQEPLRGPPL